MARVGIDGKVMQLRWAAWLRGVGACGPGWPAWEPRVASLAGVCVWPQDGEEVPLHQLGRCVHQPGRCELRALWVLRKEGEESCRWVGVARRLRSPLSCGRSTALRPAKIEVLRLLQLRWVSLC